MLVYEKAVSWRVATIFVLLLAASTLARLVLIDVYRRAKPPAEDWRRWAFWAVTTALVGGSCWGLGALFLLDPPVRNISSWCS